MKNITMHRLTIYSEQTEYSALFIYLNKFIFTGYLLLV